ncbi:MAG: hypothetical protein BroJett029_31260 [Alphaproteobacteria bacterium]|nr:MAG: hypothetical protein BroJett029_31260 [Alphaproteobacteria bacterium]
MAPGRKASATASDTGPKKRPEEEKEPGTAAPNPDLAALAERYLDLWQEQMAAMAGESGLVEAMTRLAAQTGAAFTAAVSDAARRGRDAAGGGGLDGAATGSGNADRAAAGPAPSGNGDGELDRLRRHVAALEERLARLEAGAGGEGGGAPRRPRRRRS